MKVSLKARLFALFLAIVTASVIGAATNPLAVPFAKKLGFDFGSILIFGFPVYVAFMLLHYWLCKKLRVQSRVLSAVIGAVLLFVTWLLVAVAQLEPTQYSRRFGPLLAGVVAGAVYGFASGYFNRQTAPT
jgi:uncharacterized BrkB/YihY/UPF0761 family membrane protein